MSQGSTLEPLLFRLCINDFPYTTNFKTTLFADGSVLLMSHKNLEVLQKQVTGHLQKILKCLYKNKSCLNQKNKKQMHDI